MRRSFLMLLPLATCQEADPGSGGEWTCVIAKGSDPNSSNQLGCRADFDALASEPADSSLPGATSIKTVVDRLDKNALYFQNSKRYCIHWDFASAYLSGNGLPIVPELSQFNLTEYYSPDRRFLLGAVSHYDGPDIFAYEISPYDTSDADMIAAAYRLIRDNMWNGDDLYFHPTSVAVERVVKSLPEDVKVVTTDELYAGTDYQPLNVGTTTGLLRFYTALEVDGQYTPFRELVVLDEVPNDIAIVAGVITAQFQTPLAHINVLSVNRGTPNMGLRDAQNHPDLVALEDKWVELTVGPFDWSIREITVEEADAWWEEHRPKPLVIEPTDLTVTDLRNTIDMLDLETDDLRTAIDKAIPAFGAKATNYGGLVEAANMGDPIPIQNGFGVPMYYYNQFMEDNGFWADIQAMMADPNWSDPAYRAEHLEAFQDEMRAAPMRPEVVELIRAKAMEVFPGEFARFRSSTNSEDLGVFTGAGLYTSETGQPDLPGSDQDTIEWAIKKVWAAVWNPRAYEERDYYSMNHLDVGMALLVTANFPDEEANGVAITNNPFDSSGLEPAFYVNAQEGETDVVIPDPDITADAYLQYFYTSGEPIVYIQHSSIIPEGETVLTPSESHELGVALKAAHDFFNPAYGTGSDWYALDVEWKFDDKDTPGNPHVYLKQARPFPGWQGAAAATCGPGAK